MTKLMHAGAALGEGKPVSPIDATVREADEMSLVLSNAASELDCRSGRAGILHEQSLCGHLDAPTSSVMGEG